MFVPFNFTTRLLWVNNWLKMMESSQAPSSASLKGGVGAPCCGREGVLTKDMILCRCMEEGVVDVQGAEWGRQIADVGEGWKDPKVADKWRWRWSVGRDKRRITFSSAVQWVWLNVTCGFIIRESAGASRWNTTGEPLKPACMLATADDVQKP